MPKYAFLSASCAALSTRKSALYAPKVRVFLFLFTLNMSRTHSLDKMDAWACRTKERRGSKHGVSAPVPNWSMGRLISRQSYLPIRVKKHLKKESWPLARILQSCEIIYSIQSEIDICLHEASVTRVSSSFSSWQASIRWKRRTATEK